MAEHCCAECHILFTVMLNAFMQSVVMLSVIILGVSYPTPPHFYMPLKSVFRHTFPKFSLKLCAITFLFGSLSLQFNQQSSHYKWILKNDILDTFPRSEARIEPEIFCFWDNNFTSVPALKELPLESNINRWLSGLFLYCCLLDFQKTENVFDVKKGKDGPLKASVFHYFVIIWLE